MANTSLPFEQTLIGSIAGALSNIRNLAHTQTTDDLNSLLPIGQAATTTDDAIYTNYATTNYKGSSLNQVLMRDATLGTPLLSLSNSPGRTSISGTGTYILTDEQNRQIREYFESQYNAGNGLGMSPSRQINPDVS